MLDLIGGTVEKNCAGGCEARKLVHYLSPHLDRGVEQPGSSSGS